MVKSLKYKIHNDLPSDQILAEISTPLENIVNISKELSKQTYGKIPEESLEKIRFLYTNANIISSYLGGIQGPTLHKSSPCSVLDCMMNLGIFFKAIKDHDFKINLPNDHAYCEIDEMVFLKVMMSLIDKAVHSGGSQTVVDMTSVESQINISIKDNGPGIEPIFLDKIKSSLNDKSNNSGGLRLASQVFYRINGKLEIDSTIGEGTNINITIPTIDYKPEEKNQSSLETSENAFALIVDDEPIERLLMSQVIKKLGYTPLTAEDGNASLETLETYGGDIHLILLDLMMPGMTGIDTLKLIRAKYSSSELPVIMLTGKSHEKDIVNAFQSGANDYVKKPFIGGELIARIKTHVELSRATKSYKRFVPTEFIKLLGRESVPELQLGDQKELNITVMFSDIRNYTSFSEDLSPKDNFNFINEYLSRIVPIIRKYGGFIDKFIGDSIMALFDEDPIMAIRASIDIQNELESFNRERSDKGLPLIDVGTGIHRGSLVLGVVGEKSRLESTVISDAVNTASRIEGLTKTFGTSTIISHAALEASSFQEDIITRPLGSMKIKGRSHPVKIYEVSEAKDSTSTKDKEHRDLFAKAINFYEQEKWDEAQLIFNELINKFPDDPVICYFVDHCSIHHKK